MSKRDFPLFLIDRSKPESHPFDYLVCNDKQYAFIARFVHLPDRRLFAEFIDKIKQIPESETMHLAFPYRNGGGLIMVIEEFYYDFEFTAEARSRIAHLLKKGIKKYMHAEVNRTPHSDLSIDNQIKQQELTIEHTKSNYANLLARCNGDKVYADYQIALAKATLDSLKAYKNSQEYVKLIMN